MDSKLKFTHKHKAVEIHNNETEIEAVQNVTEQIVGQQENSQPLKRGFFYLPEKFPHLSLAQNTVYDIIEI